MSFTMSGSPEWPDIPRLGERVITITVSASLEPVL